MSYESPASFCYVLSDFHKLFASKFSTHYSKVNKSIHLSFFSSVRRRTTSVSFIMCIRPSACLSAWNNSASTGRVLMKFLFLSIFRKSDENIQISLKADENDV